MLNRRLAYAGVITALVVSTGAPQLAHAQYATGTTPYGTTPYGTGAEGRYSYKHRPHAYLGLQGMGLFVLGHVTDLPEGYIDHGGGGGVFAGVRLGRYISLEANWTITFHDDLFESAPGAIVVLDSLYVMTLTGDLKIHVPTYSALEPYFQVGIGAAWLGDTGDEGMFARGPAFNAGAGADLWLNPFVSIGGRVLYRGLAFGEADFTLPDNQRDFVNTLSVDANITFHL